MLSPIAARACLTLLPGSRSGRGPTPWACRPPVRWSRAWRRFGWRTSSSSTGRSPAPADWRRRSCSPCKMGHRPPLRRRVEHRAPAAVPGEDHLPEEDALGRAVRELQRQIAQRPLDGPLPLAPATGRPPVVQADHHHPVVGDPLTVLAGVLRLPWWRATLLIGLAKGARYALVLWLAAGLVATLPPVGRAMRGAKPKMPPNPMAGPPMAGPPMAGPPMAGPPMSGPPMGGPPPGAPGPQGQWG